MRIPLASNARRSSRANLTGIIVSVCLAYLPLFLCFPFCPHLFLCPPSVVSVTPGTAQAQSLPTIVTWSVCKSRVVQVSSSLSSFLFLSPSLSMLSVYRLCYPWYNTSVKPSDDPWCNCQSTFPKRLPPHISLFALMYILLCPLEPTLSTHAHIQRDEI